MRTVFLSSTSRDLRECREAVYHAIEGLDGYHCVRMEDFGSWDTDADDLCQRLLANCDAFVILAGRFYGSVTPTGDSYTEREYQTAKRAGKPRLVFMTADTFSPPAPPESDQLRARQANLRDELACDRIVSKFSGAHDAAIKVVQAIRNWEASGDAGGASRLRLSTVGSETPPREFSEPFVGIGRGFENGYRIDDPEVSWEHGQIVRMQGQYYYKHLSETNPTIIRRRGREVLLRPGKSRDTVLHPQDRLIFGHTTILVDFDLIGAARGYVPTAKRPDE